jgi:pseudomonalisin
MIHSRIGKSGTSRLALSIGVAALSMSVSAQAAWHGTASHALALKDATQLGALPDAAPMRITVSLKLQNKAALDSFLRDSHTMPSRDYGRTLSAGEFNAAYAPSTRQAQAVVDYLRRAGFSKIEVAPNNLLVTAEAPRSQVESAFNTSIRQFKIADRMVYANTRDALVPDALDGVVLAVTGLQNVHTAHTLIQRAALKPAAALQPMTAQVPVAFPGIYNAGGASDGSNTSIGIIASGDLTQVLADLRSYESQTGLPQVPVNFVPAMVASADTSGTPEWDLDSQSSTSIAGNVKSVTFYNSPSLNDSDLEVIYNRVVTDGAVKVVNMSLGVCEASENSSGDMVASDQIFAAAAAQGVTFFLSSGDGGAYTGCTSQQEIPTAVSYPASSPYVVAVGGTTLTTNSNGGYAGETAWAGSGGGISVYEPAQPWQTSLTGSAARGVPDVAMDADPDSGATIIVSGQAVSYGGTSLAAPLATGVWARAQTAHGNSLGFAAPLIYATYASTPAAFHDITSGCNIGSNVLVTLFSLLLGQKNYCSGAGYDYVTGVGTFDIATFVPAV